MRVSSVRRDVEQVDCFEIYVKIQRVMREGDRRKGASPEKSVQTCNISRMCPGIKISFMTRIQTDGWWYQRVKSPFSNLGWEYQSDGNRVRR